MTAVQEEEPLTAVLHILGRLSQRSICTWEEHYLASQ